MTCASCTSRASFCLTCRGSIKITTILSVQQVWFQNRRARYFKSKKPSSEVPKSSTDYLHTPAPSPPFYNLAPSFPLTPSLPSPPGYPAPSLPQSTRLSTILGSQATSPVFADQATSCSPHGLTGVPQDHYSQNSDFIDYCLDVTPHDAPTEWDLTEDFETFLGIAQGSEPVSSRCAAVAHHGPKEDVQGLLDQHFSITDESMDDLSDLCLPDLGDFNLSDLNISAAMIDYLLG